MVTLLVFSSLSDKLLPSCLNWLSVRPCNKYQNYGLAISHTCFLIICFIHSHISPFSEKWSDHNFLAFFIKDFLDQICFTDFPLKFLASCTKRVHWNICYLYIQDGIGYLRRNPQNYTSTIFLQFPPGLEEVWPAYLCQRTTITNWQTENKNHEKHFLFSWPHPTMVLCN